MTEIPSPAEAAERLGRNRARIVLLLAPLLIAQQVTFFMHGEPAVKHGAWMVMSAVILAIMITGGAWHKPRAIRDLMNDGITRANRESALTLGFVTVIVTAIGLTGLEAFAPGSVGALSAIRIIVTAGFVAALLRFGLLEWRALG